MSEKNGYTCISCGGHIKPCEYGPENGCELKIHGWYPSRHDGQIFKACICDECVEEKIAEGDAEYLGEEFFGPAV